MDATVALGDHPRDRVPNPDALVPLTEMVDPGGYVGAAVRGFRSAVQGHQAAFKAAGEGNVRMQAAVAERERFMKARVSRGYGVEQIWTEATRLGIGDPPAVMSNAFVQALLPYYRAQVDASLAELRQTVTAKQSQIEEWISIQDQKAPGIGALQDALKALLK